jgi:hypothetical protein
MYKIIGADQKEYGPITADQIRQWIAEGRVNGQTHACLEGTQEWKPLSMFPEFGFTGGPAAGSSPVADPGAPVTAQEILARDYSLDIGSCVKRGWECFKNNFGLLFGASILLLVLGAVAGGVAQVVLAGVGVSNLPYSTRQYLTPIYVIMTSLVVGPASGGLYRIYLAVIRGKPVNPGDIFTGFTSGFQDLFLGKLVTGLLMSVCMIPYVIASSSKMDPIMARLEQHSPSDNPQEMVTQMISAFTSSLPAFLLCMIPITYLSVNRVFTLALIGDKQMGFWTAMKTSWKMVHKHWFQVFGLVVVIGLLNLAGFLVCCFGFLVTFPIGVAALMYAYEDIFGRKNA